LYSGVSATTSEKQDKMSKYCQDFGMPASIALNGRLPKCGNRCWNCFTTFAGPQNIITSGYGSRHIYFRYKVTSGDIAVSAIEMLDLENVDVAVGILCLGGPELDICWMELLLQNDCRGKNLFQFSSRHLGLLDTDFIPVSTVFYCPAIFRKSHLSA
jgi:hypothetical protein